MKSWSVQDAKARFSEFLENCLQDGPQLVTKRGTDAAVLVPIEAWQQLQRSARPVLKELLLGGSPRGELQIPARGSLKRRAPSAQD
ncbi:MAG: type II toxin-antitoxin system Phd/YefM family antitoxin [Proteobacteria bacterium]|nr:type II toxin-antitoxin system Phd/YefM family antitoxin [Pseudomonadota bacterium]